MSVVRRPNVLWICTEHQRYITIHALGNEHIRTPNLDRLVAGFRDGVYCEYYNSNPAETSPHKCRAYITMWRDRRYKIVVYHGEQFGELYDLERDPDEFENQWDNPDYSETRFAMMKRCFDARVFAMDPMPPRKSAF